MNRINQALSLAERGYSVFPCIPNGKTPAVAGGFYSASNDPDRIAEMFDKVPDANIGLATAGLVVVDIDPLPDGSANPWAESVPDSLEPGGVTLTPRGGQHWYFRRNGHDIGISTGKLAPNVDVRGTGGYVVAPGSVIDGKVYEPLVELPPRDQLPVVPEFIESKLIGDAGLFDRPSTASTTPPPTSSNATPAKAVSSADADDVIPEGTRNDTMFRWACSLRRIGLSDAEIRAAMRERNRRLCKPPISDRELSRIAIRVAKEYEPDQTAQAVAEGWADQDRIMTAAERFTLHDGAALDSMDCTLDFLIHNVLVAGQPCIVAGPKKSLKTSVMIEMGISLASGAMCFGQFVVPQPKRVLLMSGESGAGTIQETARRICEAKGITLANLERFVCSFDLPRLADPADLARLKEIIQAGGFDVVMIDPAYLALAGLEDAGNLFAVGGMLAPLTELGKECNTTLVIAHHTKKNLGNPYEQPELGDIAWAGFAEWSRQWVLLNRRGPFDPESGGHHELWLSTGGSAGHGGAWSLDITEGRRTDPGGRTWIVDLGSARAAKAERADERATERDRRKETAAEAKQVKHRERLLDVLAKFPAGETKRAIRDAAGLSGKDAEPVFLSLIEEGLVETVEIKKHNGCHPGFRLKQSTNEVGQVGLSGTDRDQSRVIPVGRDAPI